MQVKKQELEPDMGQWTGSKLGKEYDKAVYCHAAYLGYMQSTSCDILGQDEAQAGIKISRRNINNLIYANDTTLMAESEEEMKSRDETERGEWKCWFKTQHSENEDHGIWSHYFMANRCWNNGNSERLFFGDSKITADGDGSLEIKRRFLEEKLWPT